MSESPINQLEVGNFFFHNVRIAKQPPFPNNIRASLIFKAFEPPQSIVIPVSLVIGSHCTLISQPINQSSFINPQVWLILTPNHPNPWIMITNPQFIYQLYHLWICPGQKFPIQNRMEIMLESPVENDGSMDWFQGISTRNHGVVL